MMFNLGFDIGGTKCAVLLGDRDCKDGSPVLNRVAFQTEGSPKDVVERACALMQQMLGEAGANLSDVTGIGISCGGPLDSSAGVILSPPNLIGWDKVPVVEMFQKRLGIKTKIENDANACALAEWRYGAGKGFNNVIFLTFGTGLGAGLIFDGRLYRGTNDMAGEVGHIRLSENGPVGYGRAGSFEGFCSGGGIAQLARQMVLEQLQQGEKPAFCPTTAELSELTAKIVGEAAVAGDPLARSVFAYCGEYLGRGLAILVDILNPEIIILGSIFARCEELIRPAMEKSLERECISYSLSVCKVAPSGLGEDIGDYAALSVAAGD